MSMRRSLFPDKKREEKSAASKDDLRGSASPFWSSAAPSISFAATPSLLLAPAEDAMELDQPDPSMPVVDVVRQVLTFYPVIKTEIDPEHENIFEELASFLNERTHLLGSKCPANSPLKAKAPSKNGMVVVKPEDSELLCYKLSILGEVLENMWDNKSLEQLGVHHGCNYPLLISKAKSLLSHLATMSDRKFADFMINDNEISMPNDELQLVRKNLNILQFIVLLKLAINFPLVNAFTIYNELKINSNKDIYKLYHKMREFLYNNTLTRQAAEPYLFVKHAALDFGFGRK